MSETADGQPVTRVECRASNEPFVRQLIIVAMILGGAVWIHLDPSENGHAWKPGDLNNNLSFLYNYYLPCVLAPLGLAFLGWVFFQHSRRLVADEKGIGFAGKEQIAWGRVTRIDAALLASKGLLTLHYVQDGPAGQENSGNAEKTLKLDSYKFHNFRDLVAFAERHVPADKIQR